MNPIVEKITQFGLDQNQALQISSIFKTEVFLKKNDIWLKENAVCEHLGFITAGMCRHFYINDNGDEITRWVSLENEFITSLGSFIRKMKTNENIQAIATSKIFVAQKEDWDAYCNDHEFARIFWTRAMEEYLIGMEERVYSFIALNAENRYKYLKNSYPGIVLNVPDKYLASILGIQPRHLSRLRAGKK
jgi:CRP/FNR family transcriptional regulator, anaerobic regulatory protein